MKEKSLFLLLIKSKEFSIKLIIEIVAFIVIKYIDVIWEAHAHKIEWAIGKLEDISKI